MSHWSHASGFLVARKPKGENLHYWIFLSSQVPTHSTQGNILQRKMSQQTTTIQLQQHQDEHTADTYYRLDSRRIVTMKVNMPSPETFDDEYDDDDYDYDSSSRSNRMTEDDIETFEIEYGIDYDPYYDDPYTEDELPEGSFREDKQYGDRFYDDGEVFYKDASSALFYRQGARPRSISFFSP